MGKEDFTGRSALITGAASGIGAACAKWLDSHGISELVLVDLDRSGLDALELGCQVRRYAGDVSDPKLWETIEKEVKRLDHALVNAGIANGGGLVELEFAEWRRILSVNLDGAFLALRTALRVMKRCGAGKSVVLTSSSVGVKPVAHTAAYGTSKAAVIHLARTAAIECLADGIRINAVAPGRVDTPIWTKTDQFKAAEAELGDRQAALDAMASQLAAVGGFATVEELSDQIGFLLSDRASNITGTVLVSDGGYTIM
jgi:NAD(P)-dependent dehydrogenase (short-subunit alcohol dehydrogenase family)